MIRNSLYGVDAEQFVLGERLITKKPVVAPDGKTIILPTSCEVTVQKISETRHYGYQVWQLNVKTDEGLLRQIFVLNKAEEKRYQQELEEKHQSAIRNPMLWRKYYWWKDDVFAQVWNCFALTIHNSQGSTFDEGGVDGNDILTRLFVGESDESYQQKLREHNRLYYVGNSRFRHRVLFIHPSSKRLNRLDY
jgi:exodeoxyribonuclease-5